MAIDPTLIQRVMRLEITRIEDMSPEPSLPVDAATLRTHCRALTTDDTMLELYQRAAIQSLENESGKTIVARQHVLVLGDFPRTGEHGILLPRGKTQSISKIDYSATDGTVTMYGDSSDLSPGSADYQEDLTGDNGGVVYPVAGSSWATPDFDSANPVKITFTAGYNEGEVPPDIIEAIMFLVSTLFEHRGAADLIVGGSVNKELFSVAMLLIQTRQTHPFA
ncbi:MAG TPA: hypothetical protein VL329_11915 [Nitrospiraceae bacterium]|jgi:uncharacterized phiE125 gp8 family phage protein|nr:hypothetical protein [Nitrospiraceae bacterium]